MRGENPALWYRSVRITARIISILVPVLVLVVYSLVILGFSVQVYWRHSTIAAREGALEMHSWLDPDPGSDLRVRVLGPAQPRKGYMHLIWGSGLPRRVPSFGYRGIPRYGLQVPLWLLALSSLAACVLVWRYTKHGSALLNCCPKCSYSLHGNVSGICPECGTPIPAGTCQKSNESEPEKAV
jgi:hypothetical protein